MLKNCSMLFSGICSPLNQFYTRQNYLHKKNQKEDIPFVDRDITKVENQLYGLKYVLSYDNDILLTKINTFSIYFKNTKH